MKMLSVNPYVIFATEFNENKKGSICLMKKIFLLIFLLLAISKER